VSDAVTTYRAAIDREDADAASWLKLGNALALLEDYTASAHAFEAAIRRSPELAAAHNGLGASLMHLSDEDPTRRPDAVRALERAFELDPSDPNPLMNLALLAERDGVPDAARSAWERVLEVWPGSPIATRRLARLPAS
jgi:cytochrome c-type biogenesis protein CcmH/NrfG